MVLSASSLRSIVVFSIGAIPAAFWTGFALLVGLFGIYLSLTVGQNLFTLWSVLFGVFCCLGTVAMWAAIFQRTNGVIALGLVCGLLVMVNFIPDGALYFDFLPDLVRACLVYGPFWIAVFLVVEYLVSVVKSFLKRG